MMQRNIDKLTTLVYWVTKISSCNTAVGCLARMAREVISIQNGGGMLTSSIRRAHGVRTKVGRLRKHSVLKSDWFSTRLVILTYRKNKY